MTKLTTIAVDQLQSMQGTKLGISPWIQLSQSMVNQFAAITHEPQFLHIDPARAETEYLAVPFELLVTFTFNPALLNSLILAGNF